MKLSYSVLRNSTLLAVGLAAGTVRLNSQTLIDMKTQSKSVDFSAANATKPMKTGAALPASCGVGELFFLLGAPAGQNTYGCAAQNTWTLQSGGSGVPTATGHANQLLTTNGSTSGWLALGGDVSGAPNSTQVAGLQGRAVASTQPTDGQVLTWSQSSGQWQPGAAAASGTAGQFNSFGVTFTNSTTLTLAVGCTTSSPCNVRFGNTVYSITATSTAVLQSGPGVSYIYMTSAGVLTVGSSMSISCSPGCSTVSDITGFPSNVVPLYIWNAFAAGWDPNGGSDLRAPLSAKVLNAGLGLIQVDSGPQSTISVDASSVPGYLAGSATLGFPTVGGASCSSELTISVPGANPGDAIAPGWPSTLAANLMGVMRVSAADTVAVKLCNPTGTAATVPASLFRAAIVRAL